MSNGTSSGKGGGGRGGGSGRGAPGGGGPRRRGSVPGQGGSAGPRRAGGSRPPRRRRPQVDRPDVDVHDPRYLVDDLRQAVKESARCGVQVACVNIGGAALGAGDPLRASFRAGAYRVAAGLVHFPACAGAALRSAGRT